MGKLKSPLVVNSSDMDAWKATGLNYRFYLNTKVYIDGERAGNLTRFINASEDDSESEANCEARSKPLSASDEKKYCLPGC